MKLKTNKSAKKRIKLKKNKLYHKKAFKRHLLRKKNSIRLQRLSKIVQLHKSNKKAILKLAGVLEYLKKDKILSQILDKGDSSDLFNIANRFGIRHHNPDQKTEYDKDIWYDWIFQYSLLPVG